MAEQATKEPTMEEILASIRRIISEDGEPETAVAHSAPRIAAEAEDDEAMFDDDPDFADEIDDFESAANDLDVGTTDEADHLLSLEDLLSDEAASDEDEPEAPAIEPAPQPSAKVQHFQPQARTESDMPATQRYQDTVLTEEKTADAAAGALGRLIASMDMGGENTIEGLVRELLKPMIKDWLDANLPQIVETKVEAEVQRIAKMVR